MRKLSFSLSKNFHVYCCENCILYGHVFVRPYIFSILGLQIFFQNIKVERGKKIKIKIAKKFFFI